MRFTRYLLIAVGLTALAYAFGALFLIGTLDFGVALAISAACLIGVELINKLDEQQMRAYRQQQWARRDAEYNIRDAYQGTLADDFSWKWDDK